MNIYNYHFNVLLFFAFILKKKIKILKFKNIHLYIYKTET